MSVWLYAKSDLLKIRRIWDRAADGGNGWPTVPEAAAQIGVGERAFEHWNDRGCPYLPDRRTPIIKLDFRMNPTGIHQQYTVNPRDVSDIADARTAEAEGLVPQRQAVSDSGFSAYYLNRWATRGCPALAGQLLYREMRRALKRDGRPLEQWHYRRSELKIIRVFKNKDSILGGAKRLTARTAYQQARAEGLNIPQHRVRHIAREAELPPLKIYGEGKGKAPESWDGHDLMAAIRRYMVGRDEKRRALARRLSELQRGRPRGTKLKPLLEQGTTEKPAAVDASPPTTAEPNGNGGTKLNPQSQERRGRGRPRKWSDLEKLFDQSKAVGFVVVGVEKVAWKDAEHDDVLLKKAYDQKYAQEQKSRDVPKADVERIGVVKRAWRRKEKAGQRV